VDYWGIVSEAWRVAWRNRSLWWLGLIQGVAGLVGGLFVLAVVLPLGLASALPTASRDFSRASLPFDPAWFIDTLGRFWVWIALGLGIAVAAWLAVAILDVAAFGGLVAEVDQAERGQPASASRGLRAGFKAWWRIAGLLALTIMPTLLVLLVRAIALYFAVAVPLQAGRSPDINALAMSSQGLSSLQNLASLVAIPLGVIVQLAVRFAIIDDVALGRSLGAAWDVCKRKLGQVVLVYLVLMLVTIVVALAVGLLVGVFVAVVGMALALALSAQSGVSWVVGGVGVVVLLAGTAAFTMIYLPFRVALWNVSWQALSDRDLRFVRPLRPYYPPPVVSGLPGPSSPAPPVPNAQAPDPSVGSNQPL
jgi:hypothetical protein